MSNDGYLFNANAVPRQGNNGYLFARNTANGIATVTFELSADPVPLAIASVIFDVTGQGQAASVGSGVADVEFALYGQGTANRGDGLASVVFDVNGQANPASGLATVEFLVSAAGFLHSTYAPEFVIPGIAFDGVNLVIPISSLPGVSSAEADDSTGDSRAILLGLMAAFSKHLGALRPLDRPWSMRMHEHWTYEYKHKQLGVCDRAKFVVSFNIEDDANNVVQEV